MSSIINPVNGYRGALERKGIKPRNHHKDNMRSLRRKQDMNRMSKAVQEEANRQANERVVPKKYKGITSQIARQRSKKKQGGHTFLKRKEDAPRTTKPYVSRKQDKAKPPLPDRDSTPPNSGRTSSRRDFLKENRSLARSTKPRGPRSKSAGATNKNFGRVPDYLIERKIELAKKKEAKRQAACQRAEVPYGMVMVPEQERLETLEKLHQSKKVIAGELGRFPLVVETMGRKKAKKALENKMNEIENAIKIFSQKKVYLEE